MAGSSGDSAKIKSEKIIISFDVNSNCLGRLDSANFWLVDSVGVLLSYVKRAAVLIWCTVEIKEAVWTSVYGQWGRLSNQVSKWKLPGSVLEVTHNFQSHRITHWRRNSKIIFPKKSGFKTIAPCDEELQSMPSSTKMTPFVSFQWGIFFSHRSWYCSALVENFIFWMLRFF